MGIIRKEVPVGGRESYGNLGSCIFSITDALCFASPSASTSSKWYSSASLSVERWVTRSVRSMVREVNPLASR